MWKRLKKFIEIRGLLETMLFIIWLTGVKIRSLFIIFFYRIRGYTISYDVLFYGKTFLQRSKKDTIRIQQGCSFEDHIKMRCYGNGTISIGKNVSINEYSMISAGDFVTIGNDVVIGAFCYINDTNHEFPKDGKLIREQAWTAKGITIEDNVWIGANVTILDNVTIGKNSVIGAGAVVTKDVSPGTVVAGVPAKELYKISYEKNRN